MPNYFRTCSVCSAEHVLFRRPVRDPWLCEPCRKEEYKRSDKGKASTKRHTQGDAFKATQKQYLQSDKGKAKQRRYKQSDKGKKVMAKENHKRYWADPEYYRKKALERVHGTETYQLDNKCAWCETCDNLSFDHMHPQIRGGKGVDENLQTLCISCNAFKNDRLVTPGLGVLIGGSY